MDGSAVINAVQAVFDRKLKGINAHRQLCAINMFINANGQKRQHQLQYFNESKDIFHMLMWFNRNYMMMLKFNEAPVNLIPAEFYSKKSNDITGEEYIGYLKKYLNMYKEMEEATIKIIQNSMKEVQAIDGFAYDYLKDILIETVQELEELNKIIINYNQVGYNMQIVTENQQSIHDDCKKELKR